MKKISTFALGLMLASAAFAQKGNNNTTIPTFQETMGKYFLVGAAVNTSLTGGQDPAGEEVVKKQFNQVEINCLYPVSATVPVSSAVLPHLLRR